MPDAFTNDRLRRDDPALDSVLITAELEKRPARPPDHAAENRALRSLAGHLAASPHTILLRLSEVLLDLLQAGSAGVSLISEETGDSHWPAISGAWSLYIGGSAPPPLAPCGVVLDRKVTQLIRHPEKHFTALRDFFPVITELLITPFFVEGKPLGTIWVASHSPTRHFDREDRRLLESLSQSASAAYQASSALGKLEAQSLVLRDAKYRLEALLANSEVATWVWDTVENRVYADASLQSLFGVSDEDARGGPIDHYIASMHPADQDRVQVLIERALRSGELFEAEYRVTRPDGSLRWVKARGRAYRQNGRVVRFPGVILDVTARREAMEREQQAREALAAREEFLRHVVASSADCIEVLDSSGRVQWLSEPSLSVREIRCFSDVEGAPWTDLWDVAQHAEVERSLHAARNGGTGRFRGRSPANRGGQRWWDVVTTPMIDADKVIRRILAISRDVTGG